MTDPGAGEPDALVVAGIGRWRLGPDGLVTYDAITAGLLGVAESSGPVDVDTFLAGLHPDDVGPVATSLRSALRDEQPLMVEFRVGSGAWVSWARLRAGSVPARNGTGPTLAGVAADTTDLRLSRERAGRSLHGISEGVLVMENDGTVAFANSAATRILGLEAEQVVGRPLAVVLGDEDSPFEVNRVWAVSHRRPVAFEMRAGAHRRWLEVRIVPAPDGLYAYLRDVDAVHEASREREDLVGRLEAALARGRQQLALTQALAPALTLQAVTEIVTSQARVGVGAVFAGIALLDDTRTRLRYVSLSPFPEEVEQRWHDIPIDTHAPVAHAAREQREYFHESIDAAEAAFPGIGEHMRVAGTFSMAHLPLVGADDRTLGTLALSWGAPHAMTTVERDHLRTMAGLTGAAIERALLFETQSTVASALQSALLPLRLPSLPGLRVAARYVPSATGLQVCGDWYDAFLLDDGRLAVAVGDAVGHGLPAARAMSLLRNGLRAYALVDPDPGTVLNRLGSLVERLEPDTMATAVLLVVDPADGRVVWAAAGHPPPVVCRAAGGQEVLDDGDADPPLGAGLPVRTRTLHLDTGDTVLAYTDGLVERRDSGMQVGIDRLVASAARLVDAGADLGAAVEAVVDALMLDEGPRDDVCLLALGRAAVVDPPDAAAVLRAGPATDDADDAQDENVLTTLAAPSSISRTAGDRPVPALRVSQLLHAVPQAAGQGRRLAATALADWGVEQLEDGVLLVVSELVTNALTHAGSSVLLDLELISDGVRVTVTDASSEHPRLRDAEWGEEHGRGVAMVDLLAARWGTRDLPVGKAVWADLLLDRPDPP